MGVYDSGQSPFDKFKKLSWSRYRTCEGAFKGGFDCSDNPMDNYIYFACLQIKEDVLRSADVKVVSLKVNGVSGNQIDAREWNYCDYLYLGKDDGIALKNGDVVSLCLDGYEVAKWMCDISHPLGKSIINYAIDRWNKMPDAKKVKLCGTLVRNVFKFTYKMCTKK